MATPTTQPAPPTSTPTIEQEQNPGAQDLFEQFLAYLTGETLTKAAIFLVIIIAGWLIAGVITGGVRKLLTKSNRMTSDMLNSFIVAWTKRLLFIVSVIIALETVGVSTAPIIAGIGVFGFVLGFAMQDTLSNFANGMMLLIYRPFEIGQVVDIGGTVGKVTSLSIVNTTLTTPDNREIIMPNKNVWGNTITNITKHDTRRVDFTVSVGYDADLDAVRKLLLAHVSSHELVLDEPGIQIEVATWGESSVDFVVRPWAKTGDYWAVFFDLTRTMKQLLDEHNIDIPFPQRVVHLRNPNEAAS